jgi:hypothetical protein
VTNGFVLAWAFSLMWSMRFPGSYQALSSAVVGIAVMILLAILAGNSGLLNRQNLPWVGTSDPGDGVWASALASAAMLLIVISGVLVAICAVLLPALGEQPPGSLLAAAAAAVAFGVLPLAVMAAAAAMNDALRRPAALGGGLMVAAALLAVGFWAASGIVPALAAPAALAEILIAVGLVLMVDTTRDINAPPRQRGV